MPAPNYESKWWGYIYDQMMTEDLPELLDDHLRFYRANLRPNLRPNLEETSGPVLECGCGTGLIILPLLADGLDIYGFDISSAMLATLRKKARTQGLDDIEARLAIMDFETFEYERKFETIIIPSNAFRMLATQEAQIKTLQNIYAHLIPGGRLLLDLRLAGLRALVEDPEVVEGRWHTWRHPETGLPIRQRVVGRYDFDHQLVLDQCYIKYQDQSEDFPMTSRWIFKDEFQLLLRLGGFERWTCYGTPDGDPLVIGLEETESYWIAYKKEVERN